MIEKCYDEGTIQAFLDGELDTDTLETVARHTAACDACSLLLQETEEESAFAFSALDYEFSNLVPTERIRTNLYEAISQIEKPRKSVWSRIFGGASWNFNLSNPSLVAFGSLLMVAGIFTTLYVHRESQNAGAGEVAKIQQPKATVPSREIQPDVKQSTDTTAETEVVSSGGSQNAALGTRRQVVKSVPVSQPTFEKASYRTEKTSLENLKSSLARQPSVNSEKPESKELLIGEESYVKTIATLTENVNTRKDAMLRPSERVAFEQDLAVVDDAIKKMKKEVRRNPRNEAAKQVLRSSYQNKIDLLNSVAEKTELMASLD
jgi:anti-sigma factor RsiW